MGKLYTILSVEGEVLITSSDLNKVKSKFLSYARQTKEDYLKFGTFTEEEVKEQMEDIENLINKNEYLFNNVLIDYGFEKLITKES